MSAADRYLCCDDVRRALLLTSAVQITGIDYIEVTQGKSVSHDSFIDVYLVTEVPAGQSLVGDNFVVEGGVRFPAPRIDPVIAPLGGGAIGYRLTLPKDQPTDFSTYRLSIVQGPGKPKPPGFVDPRLASVEFSFKIDCASEFDCAPVDTAVPVQLPADPPFDYRARDYQGFRRLMLDRLATLVPGFREDDPADFTTTLVEALAYRADQQSYRLDWVGTEAFLSTARSRMSVTRHARLVDYTPANGVSARLFARFIVEGDGANRTLIPQQSPLLVRTAGLPPMVLPGDYLSLLGSAPVVFETVAPLWVHSSHNEMEFYTWGEADCRLPRGATAATIRQPAVPLTKGDFLVLAETRSPQTGDPDDARSDRRFVVRLTDVSLPFKDPLFPKPADPVLVTVEWAASDALTGDLVISARPAGSIAGSAPNVCAMAWGNIVLADQGASLPPAYEPASTSSTVVLDDGSRPQLVPARPTAGETWRPRLNRPDIAWVAPVDLGDVRPASATELALPDATKARPALNLDDGFYEWTEVPDLLRSSRFDRDFVVETGMNGEVMLRFGDNVNGTVPGAGMAFAATGRFGTGATGNIGTEALAHVAIKPADTAIRLTVSNPLPARGGAAPETLSSIRIAAPQAFRRQERAVTAADYAAAARRFPSVANAYAVPRWTGAWQTMLVYIDRSGGLSVDAGFRSALAQHLERFRLMGFDLALRGAVPTPLDVDLFVCARPDQISALVEQRVRAALRPNGPPDGSLGFFDPDNFTFGTPLYLSRLIAAVMAVAGVQSVVVRRFQRWGRVSFGELADGAIRPADIEVLELADDPNFPERGRLAIEMGGGR